MKKIILASVLVVGAITSGSANATAICTGGTSAGTGASPGTAATDFVRNAFTPKCSANVYLKADNAVTYFRVGSASGKGARSFMGSTAGGSVASLATCVQCSATDASAAATSTSNPTSG